MEWIADPQAWIALATLTALEIVLGIDNIIFISVLVSRLPAEQRQRARMIGLSIAMVSRILLLLAIAWIMGLTAPLFTVLDHAISGRDLILILGGLFLLGKASHEIHNNLEGDDPSTGGAVTAGFWSVLIQIGLVDVVFSIDSVVTAVGLADHVSVMIIAIVIAVGVMMVSANAVGRFVDQHPTIKMLALSFLTLIGFTLVAEGMEFHIPKGYVYFAMAFSVAVEMLNLRVRARRRKQRPVELRRSLERAERAGAEAG
ncbi:MAG: TerC family protein [Gammaproteobacteria bacterium]|nr:TerC family protein [Gammaproteobacteria bacterium]